MSSLTKPGVYLQEVLPSAQADTGISLSTACFVGAHGRGPTTPTLVTSYQQFVTLFGGFIPGTAATDLQYAVYQFFNNGGRSAYIQRLTAGTEVAALATLLDREPTTPGDPEADPPIPATAPRATLTLRAASVGSWGNALAVGITTSPVDPNRFTLTVYYGGTTTANVVEVWRDLSMDTTDARYIEAIINSPTQGSLYITADDANLPTDVSLTDRTPAATGTGSGDTFVLVPVPLSGGTAAAAAPAAGRYDLGLAALDVIDQPLNINLPGISDTALVNKALLYAEQRGDCFVVVDPLKATGSTPPTASAQITNTATYTGFSGSSSYGATYFPNVVIADPASRVPGATKVVAPGGAVLGVYAATEAAQGVSKTPAGLGTRLTGAVGLETILSDTDLGRLNASNVNAIRSLPGAGIVVMGGRTLLTSGRADRYISVRRSLIYVKSELERLVAFALFESNGSLLRQQVDSVIEQFLLQFWQSGGLSGDSREEAFFVTCDETNNPPSAVANGELHVDVGVALQRPAEFIVIQVGQFDGTVSAVEAA